MNMLDSSHDDKRPPRSGDGISYIAKDLPSGQVIKYPVRSVTPIKSSGVYCVSVGGSMATPGVRYRPSFTKTLSTISETEPRLSSIASLGDAIDAVDASGRTTAETINSSEWEEVDIDYSSDEDDDGEENPAATTTRPSMQKVPSMQKGSSLRDIFRRSRRTKTTPAASSSR